VEEDEDRGKVRNITLKDSEVSMNKNKGRSPKSLKMFIVKDKFGE
jgi:hypothetical protein